MSNMMDMQSDNHETQRIQGYTPNTPKYTDSNRWRSFYRFWVGEASHRRRRVFVVGVCLFVVVIMSFIFFAQHVLTKPDGYLYTSGSEVTFVQFTVDESEHLTGTLQDATATTDEAVKSTNDAFTGVQNGSQMSMTFSALGFSTTFTGTLQDNVLTLHIPDQNGYVSTDTFSPASVGEYNLAVAQLRQKIATHASATQSAQATAVESQSIAQATAVERQSIAQATATAQAALDQSVTFNDQQLSKDLQSLMSDTQSLPGSTNFSDATNGYLKDWKQMQQDYQHEQSDYQQGCGDNGYNVSVVAYDASTVSYDLSLIQYDDNTFSNETDTMGSALKLTQSDMQSVQSDWQNLQAAIAADKAGSLSAQFTASDVNTALTKAQEQVNISNKALQVVQGQSTGYDQEAAQMNTNAKNLAAGMHC